MVFEKFSLDLNVCHFGNLISLFHFLKVCDSLNDGKNQHSIWWLEALSHIEQNKDASGELIKKIGDAVSGPLNNARSSRIDSWLVIDPVL